MPHMKAMNVPFYFLYASLICSMNLQSEKLKFSGILADPGILQKHI